MTERGVGRYPLICIDRQHFFFIFMTLRVFSILLSVEGRDCLCLYCSLPLHSHGQFVSLADRGDPG